MLKITHRAVAFAALACACVCMLAACDDPPAKTPGTASETDKKAPPPKVADLSKDMVAAVSAGKVASAISVHFALGASPVVNKPLPVEVAIVPHHKFSVVRVYFESHDGLSTASGAEFGPANDVESEKALTHQLGLLASREGMFMVTASVETQGEEGNVTRVFSIPIIVGADPGSAPAAAPVATPAETPPGPPASN